MFLPTQPRHYACRRIRDRTEAKQKRAARAPANVPRRATRGVPACGARCELPHPRAQSERQDGHRSDFDRAVRTAATTTAQSLSAGTCAIFDLAQIDPAFPCQQNARRFSCRQDEEAQPVEETPQCRVHLVNQLGSINFSQGPEAEATRGRIWWSS